MHVNKVARMGMSSGWGLNQDNGGREGINVGGGSVELDKEKVLKVSWGKIWEVYAAEKLRQVFSRFGDVEDILIKSSKKKGSALVVMATKEAALLLQEVLSGIYTIHCWSFLLNQPLLQIFQLPRRPRNLIVSVIWLGLVSKLLKILFYLN